MFSFKSKLEIQLKEAINSNLYNQFRVIIHCKSLFNEVVKRVTSMKCTLIRSFPELNCLSVIASPRCIERLIEYPEVKYICFDKYAFLCGTNTEVKSTLPNMKDLKKSLNNLGSVYMEVPKVTGLDVCVGLIDSGVFPHDDLVHPQNRLVGFKDLVNDYTFTYDDYGHGTFMAGIIGGNGFSSKGTVKGVAPRCNIYSVKAFNSTGKAYISDTLYGLKFLIDNCCEFNIKVICMPFETFDYDPFILGLFSTLFEKAIANHITVVVPSGSNANNIPSITGIASLGNCITVSGIDRSKDLSKYNYSSCGYSKKVKKPDLCHSAININSLRSVTSFIPEINGVKCYAPHLKSPYTMLTGSSCASAYISGVCALLYEKYPNVYKKDILSLVRLCCDDFDGPKELKGAGVVNINKIYCVTADDDENTNK